MNIRENICALPLNTSVNWKPKSRGKNCYATMELVHHWLQHIMSTIVTWKLLGLTRTGTVREQWNFPMSGGRTMRTRVQNWTFTAFIDTLMVDLLIVQKLTNCRYLLNALIYAGVKTIFFFVFELLQLDFKCCLNHTRMPPQDYIFSTVKKKEEEK